MPSAVKNVGTRLDGSHWCPRICHSAFWSSVRFEARSFPLHGSVLGRSAYISEADCTCRTCFDRKQ